MRTLGGGWLKFGTLFLVDFLEPEDGVCRIRRSGHGVSRQAPLPPKQCRESRLECTAAATSRVVASSAEGDEDLRFLLHIRVEMRSLSLKFKLTYHKQ